MGRMLELSVYDQLMEQHQKMVEVGFRKGFVESRFEIFIRMINQIFSFARHFFNIHKLKLFYTIASVQLCENKQKL